MTINLERLPDARQRLDAYLDSLKNVHFDWAGIHCATFGADVVKALTGHDFAEGHRGAYGNCEDAMAYLSGLGFDNVGDYAAFYLPEIHPAQMEYGDLCIVPDPNYGPCLAMSGGHNHLVCMTLRGKGILPRSKAIRAFKVG